MADVNRSKIRQLEEHGEGSEDGRAIFVEGGFDDPAVKRDATDPEPPSHEIDGEQLSGEGNVDGERARCVTTASMDVGRDAKRPKVEVIADQDVGREALVLLMRERSEAEQTAGKSRRSRPRALPPFEARELARIGGDRRTRPRPQCSGVPYVIGVRVCGDDEADVFGPAASIRNRATNDVAVSAAIGGTGVHDDDALAKEQVAFCGVEGRVLNRDDLDVIHDDPR
jgi:hypothetical protein